MIDYLEALLEEEAGETEDSPLSGRKVLVRVSSKPSPDDREDAAEIREDAVSPMSEETAEGRADLWPDAPALARQAGWAEGMALSPRETVDALAEGEKIPLLSDRLRTERRAASAAFLPSAERSALAGEALYEALRRAARTARAGRQGPGTVALTLPDRAVSAPNLTLTDIDRAVQRDARRFDGGYTLY